ncbi:MAG: hypothetical protein KGM44_10320 [bacterium]|nr:hypothetical protein [bacterium]
MATRIERGAVTVVTATRVEAVAARRAAPGVRVVEGGMALNRRRAAQGLGNCVISCGLAGGLRSDLATGAVIIPDRVLRPDGEMLICDAALAAALEEAARRLGLQPLRAPLLTGAMLVTGDNRRIWAERGYAAADLETGRIVAKRIAAVRVILDTPQCEISARWLRPVRAMLDPRALRQLPWLAREAPRCARTAALVLAEALG